MDLLIVIVERVVFCCCWSVSKRMSRWLYRDSWVADAKN